LRYVIILKSRYRDACLNRVLAPEGELLSFAPPKESSQRKGGPLPLQSLGTSMYLALRVLCMQIGYPADLSCAPHFRRGLPEGPSLALWQRASSCRAPAGSFPAKAPVLGAANGTPSVPLQVPTAQ